MFKRLNPAKTGPKVKLQLDRIQRYLETIAQYLLKMNFTSDGKISLIRKLIVVFTNLNDAINIPLCYMLELLRIWSVENKGWNNKVIFLTDIGNELPDFGLRVAPCSKTDCMARLDSVGQNWVVGVNFRL